MRIGHRGAAGHEPENTLRSIERAIELGVDFVEMDVQLTRDGHLVILHDKRVDRTTNGRGYVSQMSLAEVQALDAGKGEKIPTVIAPPSGYTRGIEKARRTKGRPQPSNHSLAGRRALFARPGCWNSVAVRIKTRWRISPAQSNPTLQGSRADLRVDERPTARTPRVPVGTPRTPRLVERPLELPSRRRLARLA